jgi:hydrogenase maturation protease
MEFAPSHPEYRVAIAAGQATPNLLVLGIGNILLGDDGLGVRLIERLREQALPATVCFVDGGTLSFSLLEHLETADAMLVADAAELGMAPGSIKIFEDEAMDRFLSSARQRSVHEVGLCDLLDMARLSDCLPKRRALLCVQPAGIGWSESLSADVAAAFDAACAEAVAVLRRWETA